MTGNRASRPLRADAARNRELILATARTLFAEHGPGVSLNDIAHEAGVGVGTVYRRFRDKDAVLDALAEVKLTTLVELINDALTVSDPREALRDYLRAALQLRVRERAPHTFPSRVDTGSGEAAHRRAELAAGAKKLVQRARDAGAVDDDFSSADVAVLMSMIGAIADEPDGGDCDRWIDFLVDSACPPARRNDTTSLVSTTPASRRRPRRDPQR